MTRWNPQAKQAELEAYEVDAYFVGRSVGSQRAVRTRVTRREVYLDELGRPAKLVEEVIDTIEEL